MLQVGGGGVAASLAVMANASAFAQSGGVSVEGQPMPDGVTLPETPPGPRRADSVGIAVVGLGNFALNQMMPRFDRAERVHVAALVSGNRDKLRRVGDAYGVPRGSRYTYDTFDRIAQNDDVDAVYIVLPSGLHAEWAERAFAAAKHVLCEKPMALNPADCERMNAAGRRADRKLMIAYRVHFEPHNVRAMELMREGAVGDLRALRAEQANVFDRTTPAENWRLNSALAGKPARRSGDLRASGCALSVGRDARKRQRAKLPSRRRSSFLADRGVHVVPTPLSFRGDRTAGDILRLAQQQFR